MSKCFHCKIMFIYKCLPTYLLIHKRIWVNCNTVYVPSTIIINEKYTNIYFKDSFLSPILIYLLGSVCWENNIVSNTGAWICFYITDYSIYKIYIMYVKISLNLLILKKKYSWNQMSITSLKELQFQSYWTCILNVFFK